VSALRAALLWLGWAVAFSPVLRDLAQHLASNPWARYAVIFPLLFGVCALREPEPVARKPGGALLIALGLAAVLLAFFTGIVRYGRAGAALAAIGLCRRFALASGRSQVLLAFAVPVPGAVLRNTDPEVNGFLLELVAGALALTGLTFEVTGTDARLGEHVLSLGRPDTGIPLMPLFAGLSWYAGCRLRRPAWRAAALACGAALLALPVQAVAIGLALLGVAAGGAALSREALTHAPWIAITAASIASTELRARRGRRA
jgi:hypothetical protein